MSNRTLHYVIIGVLTFLCVRAQADDVFQSAPGPVVVPKIRPEPLRQPRPKREAQPPQEVAPAEPRSSIVSVDAIKQLASSRGIPVPQDLRITRPAADVPAGMARFSGIWGDGRWNGTGRELLFAVETVGSDGRCVVVFAEGGPGPNTATQTPSRWWRSFGQIDGNRLSYDQFPGHKHLITLLDDNRMLLQADPIPAMNLPPSQAWLSPLAAVGH